MLTHDVLRLHLNSNHTQQQLECSNILVSNPNGEWLCLARNQYGITKPESITGAGFTRLVERIQRYPRTPTEATRRAMDATRSRAIFIRDPPTNRENGFQRRRRQRPAETAPYRRRTQPRNPSATVPAPPQADLAHPEAHHGTFIGPPRRPAGWRTPPPTPTVNQEVEEGELPELDQNYGVVGFTPTPGPSTTQPSTPPEAYNTIRTNLIDLFGSLSEDSEDSL